MLTKEFKLALLGFGGVNRTLVELIAAHNANAKEPQIKIVGVSDLFLGHCVNNDGLDCEALLAIPSQKGAFSQLGSEDPDNTAVISNSGADVIAEATFSNMETGEPAISLCEAALLSGRHVVTTNKGGVAYGAQRLETLAGDVGCHFLYEGAVMSGTPVLVWATDCFPGAKIIRARGILNGTTNFILGEMEAGRSFSDALCRAQELGYAEADPTADIEGHDVRAKAIVLAKCLFGETLSIADVPCKGISSITPEMVAQAEKEGLKWKLVADIAHSPNGVSAQVGPALISAKDPLYGIALGTNALELTTDMLGATMVTGPGAGRKETAYAIFSDLLRLAKIVSQERELQHAG